MGNLILKQKAGILGAICYTIIIGIGMYTSFHINGVEYTDPELVNTLWYFEIALSLLAIAVAVKCFSWKEVGFTKIDKKQMLWFIPSIILIVLMWINLIQFLLSASITATQQSLFMLVGITTLMVGFSEELMYRGIVLSAFWQNQSKNKLKAVLLSAVGFSLIHAMNFFAGVVPAGVLVQLILTFFLGLFFGLMRLRIKSIIPLMIFHWLWDFVLIGASAVAFEGNGVFSLVFILHEVLIVAVLLFLLLKERSKLKGAKIENELS